MHLKTVRLMGHAGSDVEANYLPLDVSPPMSVAVVASVGLVALWSLEGWRALRAAFEELQRDDSVRAVILTGAGGVQIDRSPRSRPVEERAKK